MERSVWRCVYFCGRVAAMDRFYSLLHRDVGLAKLSSEEENGYYNKGSITFLQLSVKASAGCITCGGFLLPAVMKRQYTGGGNYGDVYFDGAAFGSIDITKEEADAYKAFEPK